MNLNEISFFWVLLFMPSFCLLLVLVQFFKFLWLNILCGSIKLSFVWMIEALASVGKLSRSYECVTLLWLTTLILYLNRQQESTFASIHHNSISTQMDSWCSRCRSCSSLGNFDWLERRILSKTSLCRYVYLLCCLRGVYLFRISLVGSTRWPMWPRMPCEELLVFDKTLCEHSRCGLLGFAADYIPARLCARSRFDVRIFIWGLLAS